MNTLIVYVLTMAGIFFLTNCNDKQITAQSVLYEEPDTRASAKAIEIPVNIKEQTEIQRAVEKGHQPWRLSAPDVACQALAIYRIDVTLKDCVVEKEDKNRAIVISKKGRSIYRVYLERMVKPDGIWTAKRIEISGG